jgi:hypothetical protein
MRNGFIGRDQELAEMAAGLESAFEGRGSVFLVAGEPGIGKTALAERVASHAAERGARVAWSRAWDGGAAAPYWLWAQIIRALAEGLDDSAAWQAPGMAHLALLAPELADRVGDPATSLLPLESDSGRFYLFEATSRFLKRLAAQQPLVLVLDDIHAADQPSLLLLRFLAREVRTARIVVVATYRDAEATRSAAAVDVLAELVREGYTLRLRAFDREEVGRLIGEVAGIAPRPGKVAAIHEATGGNPLYVREVTRLVAAEDPLDRPGRLRIPVPASVRAVIRRRLALLSADAIRVLSAAAVVGHDFELALVGAASDMPAERVLASLDDAAALGIVAAASETARTYGFSHPLIREAIYEGLPIGARTQMHQRVGVAIEKLHGSDPDQHLGELAYHFAKVAAMGESAKAGGYARRAGDRAMAAFAYEEAVVHYRRALDALALSGSPDAALRCELLLCLGRAQARAGDYRESKETALLAAGIARTLADPEPLAHAALGFGEPQVEGGIVDRQLVALLQEALDRLQRGDSALRARVAARLSLELTFADDATLRDALRETLSLEAIEMARRLGDVVALCNALRARWLARWGPDGLEERVALAEEHLTLAHETGDREIELLARTRRITCSIEAGDGAAAAIDMAAHERLAGELRMPYHEWAAATMHAARALLTGSFDQVESLAQDALDRMPGRPNALHARLNQLTLLRWEQGRLGELYPDWQRTVEQYAGLAFARGWLCLAAAELGRDDAARALLADLADDAPDLPRDGCWLPALAVASLATAQLGERDVAARLYPLLEPYAGRTIVIPMPHPAVCFGSASLYLGLLAAELDAVDQAETHFEAALRANARVDAKAFLARTRCEYARLLIRRARAGDRERAHPLIGHAAASATAMGAVRILERTAQLREPAGTAVVASEEAAIASAPADRRAAAASEPTDQRAAVAIEPTDRPAAEAASRHAFRREGEYWTVAYEGAVVRLRDSKGLRCLAVLLTSPGRELAAVELEAGVSSTPAAALETARATGSVELDARPDLGDAGALLDARARAEYRARVEELRAEIDEAESFNDPGRASRAREELEFVTAELARAVGLGGRDRHAASHAERARLNVTRAIRASLRALARAHPPLGEHLSHTIRTGRFCSYSPDPRAPITWEL